jgi:hypothetical protein
MKQDERYFWRIAYVVSQSIQEDNGVPHRDLCDDIGTDFLTGLVQKVGKRLGRK